MKEDPESSPTELSGERGTGALSPAAEQDACLLHEDDNDQSMYTCPAPTDGGGDDLEDLAAPGVVLTWKRWSPCVRQFGCTCHDGSDQMFKLSRQKRSPDNSEPITSVNTRQVLA